MKFKKLLLIFALSLIVLIIGKESKAEGLYDTIISNLDGQTFEIDKVYTLSTDDSGKEIRKYYYENLDDRVVDSSGKEVSGYYTFSDNAVSPIFGYNYVTFTFYPLGVSSDGKMYQELTGSFIVVNNKKPKITAYSNRINVFVYVGKYKIVVNGKSYNGTVIKNLKPNTNYKIKIYQKADDNFKENLLWTTTVKTKSK